MSGFSGINTFGNLTKVNYKELVEKYDANKDGELSSEEFKTALKKEKLDKIDISSVNTNGDDKIDENEMAVYEQKYKMQTAINNMSKDITKDFSGTKSQYIAQVTLELTNYITEFSENYKDDVSGMAEAFEKALPTKYAEIKKNVLANDPSTFKSQVLDDLINGINTTSVDTKGTSENAISETAQKKIGQALETEANKYIKTNPKCTQEELKAHLEAFMNQTNAEKMKSAADTFTTKASGFGTYIDSDELTQLKEYAKDFLTEAVNNGVTVKLGSRNIATTNAIATALKSYTDGATLKADMETAISDLSTVSKKEALITQDKVEQAEAAEKNFTNIKGDSYKINAGLIDYSKIDSRYYDGGEIYQRGKGWNGSKDKAYDEGYNILTSDNMKSQIKSQIETMLKEQGIAFDKIENIFENVYNQTAQDVLNSDGMITGRGARGFSSKGKAKINVKTMIDTFVTTFNTNISKAIDEKNASNKDFDTIDLDFTQAGKDENGNTITDEATGKDVSQLYAKGGSITTKRRGADYYMTLADQMIERMKSQMLTKAKAMCTANGVEFDESAFTTIFNNAKATAKNAGVSGIGSNGKSFGGVATSTGGAAVAGTAAMAGAGYIGATTAGVTLGATTFAGAAAEVAAFATGPIGWAIGGVAAVGTALGLIGFGHHSKSTLNAKTLLDTFAEQFKTNYTTWVEEQTKKTAKK